MAKKWTHFCASSRELIETAKQKWIAQQFDKIEGDAVEFVPYPSFKR